MVVLTYLSIGALIAMLWADAYITDRKLGEVGEKLIAQIAGAALILSATALESIYRTFGVYDAHYALGITIDAVWYVGLVVLVGYSTALYGKWLIDAIIDRAAPTQ